MYDKKEEDDPPGFDESVIYVGNNDAAEIGDVFILNSLVGHESPRSVQLWGEINGSKIQILIDSRSTLNFIQPSLVEKVATNSSINARIQSIY